MLGEGEEQTLAWVAYAVLGGLVRARGHVVGAGRPAAAQRGAQDETTPLRWLRADRRPHGQDRVLRGQCGADRPAARVRGRRAAPAHRLRVLGRPGVAADRGAARRSSPTSWAARTRACSSAARPTAGPVYALRDALADRPEVEQVVDLLTMMIGTDQILLCARLDFDDALDAAVAGTGLRRDRRRPARALPGPARRSSSSRCRARTRRSASGCWSATGRRGRTGCGRGSARI